MQLLNTCEAIWWTKLQDVSYTMNYLVYEMSENCKKFAKALGDVFKQLKPKDMIHAMI